MGILWGHARVRIVAPCFLLIYGPISASLELCRCDPGGFGRRQEIRRWSMRCEMCGAKVEEE